jgi:hypothetical protein
VLAQIVLAVSLVLLVAAPAPAAGGSAQPAQIELLDEAAPFAEEEAVAAPAAAHAASHACAASRHSSAEIVPPGPALARIFRPPRRSIP